MKSLLLGNEAIAYAALEAGIQFVSGYPGTPSTEVIETLQELIGTVIYAERATNEKTAFELALGAALGGIKAMATMKAPGILVASDPIVSSAYSGINGALVIYVADDPGPHTTQTEQDSRRFAKLSKLPLLEPSDPQEAYEYTKKAVELSERLKIPIILRSTTRVAHTVGIVEHSTFSVKPEEPRRRREPERFIRAGMKRNRERHKRILERLEEFSKLINDMHKIEGSGEIAIVTVGVSYHYVKEALKKLGVEAKIIKLASSRPIDKNRLLEALRGINKIIVVEELDGFLEEELRSLLYDKKIEIHGKDIIPQIGELNVDIVAERLGKFFGKDYKKEPREKPEAPPRTPPLCPGCPHRFSYMAIKEALKALKLKRQEVPIFGDIGCYALSMEKPIEGIDTEHSMGSSIAMAAGLKLAGYDKPVIATIGDSTLLHGGLPELIEAYHKRADIIVVILDNGTIAMTGHQETPERLETATGRKTKPIRIEDLVRPISDRLRIVDPVKEYEEAIEVMKEALKASGLRVVIMRSPCTILALRKRLIEARPMYVDPEKCIGCKMCIINTGCPALYRDEKNKKAYIDEVFCVGCGLCAKYCPTDAIKYLRSIFF